MPIKHPAVISIFTILCILPRRKKRKKPVFIVTIVTGL